MTIAIRYTDGRTGAVLLGSGRLTGTELATANRELFARDFVAEPLLYVLIDGSTIAVEVTDQDIRTIAQENVRVSARAPQVAVAIFVRNPLSYGLARMWQAYVDASGWRTAVFEDRAAAVAWLRSDVSERTGIAITLE
ncbi:MAG TPA: hypothetical protein VF113_15385 [Stellaceae bacterium]